MKHYARPQKGSAHGAAKQAASQPESTPAEFKVVRLRECPVNSAVMDNPGAVVKFWREHVQSAAWFKADKECLVVLLLDTRHQVMGFEMLSLGTKDTLLVNVPEVFRLAAMKSAAKIVLAHNHPSGNPSPSEADIKVTRDIIRAGALIRIDLADHVVIGAARAGAKDYGSLRELGFFYELAAPIADYSASASGQATAPVIAMNPQSDGAPAAAEKLAPLKRESIIGMDRPDMEVAVQRALSLLELFARMDCVLSDRSGKAHQSSRACGFNLWGWDCGKALHAAWTAAHAAMFKDKLNTTCGDKIAASRKLGAVVRKARVLLLMLSHDLSRGGCFREYEFAEFSNELPEEEGSPYVSLAADCVEYLEASFYDGFGRHLPMDKYERESWDELLQKFVQPQQDRAAA